MSPGERRQALLALLRAHPEGMTAGQIAAAWPEADPARYGEWRSLIHQQMVKLRRDGLVTGQRIRVPASQGGEAILWRAAV